MAANDPRLDRLGEDALPFPPAGERLDANVAAAFVDGMLVPEERARLRASLDAAGAAELDHYLEDAERMSAELDRPDLNRPDAVLPVRHWRWRWRHVAAAALVMVAVGAFFALRTSPPSAEITLAQVNESLRDLSSAEPQLFGDVRELTDAEIESQSPLMGAAPTLHEPRSVILDSDPTLRWSDPHDNGPYRVQIEGRGVDRRGVTGTSVSWSDLGLPGLAPGDRVRWRVTGKDGKSASMVFTVMATESLRDYQAKLSAIERHVDGDRRALVAAVVALRAEAYSEAKRILSDAGPGAVAKKLRRRVLSVLDYPFE